MTGLACALFLDFDGTLVDIAARPDAVRVEPGLPQAMDTLRRRLDGALAVVTGRGIDSIDSLLVPYRFDVAGLHGAQVRVAGRMLDECPVDVAFRAEVAWLREACGEGLLVEDKGLAVALHWRLVPERQEEALSLAAQTLARLGPGWRSQRGKAVVEILPAGAGKGNAIARLMSRPPYEGRVPVFAGDDDTDEHGFREVLARNGLAVRIGQGESLAPLRLPGPEALRAALSQWGRDGRCPFEPPFPPDRAPVEEAP